MSNMPKGEPRTSSDGLGASYEDMLRRHTTDVAGRSGAAAPSPAYSPFRTPDNLPPGFKVYDDGEGRRNIYMQDPQGRLHFTPDYAAQVKGLQIDWPGVAIDLGAIALGADSFLEGATLKPLLKATGALGLQALKDSRDAGKTPQR